MFNDLLDQPRRELEALKARCDAQGARISKFESMLAKCATQEALRAQCAEQEARIAKLESMLVKCAADRPLSISALRSMGFTVPDFKANGYQLHNIMSAFGGQLSLTQLASMGYQIKELRYIFKVKDFKDAGFKLQALKDGAGEGYGPRDDWPYLTEAAFNLL
jgi:hypothetical protein